ncbi:MAG: hypothetical protein NXI31_11495 [bacterium]|nr:hypothetical protein [bacterium]
MTCVDVECPHCEHMIEAPESGELEQLRADNERLRNALADQVAASVEPTDDQWMIFDWSGGGSDQAFWWRPNASGYTTNLREAGVYTREDAERWASARLQKPVQAALVHVSTAWRLARPVVDWCEMKGELDRPRRVGGKA